jgi:hypothetical protein
MTRKRRKPEILRPTELEHVQTSAREEADPEEDRQLDEVFADFPQNETCIELYRVNAQGGRPMFLDQLSPSEFSMAYVTEKFGGGRYRAKAKYKNGDKVDEPFEIEGDPFPVKRKLPSAWNATPLEPVLPTQRSGFQQAAVVETGNDFQAAMLAMMRQLMQEARGSEMAFLEKMKLYKEMFAPQTQKEAPLDVALNMFTKGVELAGMQQGGDGPNFWMMALRELKDPLTKIVDTISTAVSQQKPQLASALVQPGAAPLPVPPPSPAPVPEPVSGDDMILLFVKSVLPSLINGAAKNADPATYADFLLDQVPGSAYDALRSWLLAPDCLERLAMIEPGIRFQQEWWSSLRSTLLESLNEELGHAVRPLHPRPDTEPPAGDSTDHPDVS